ncbi:hypothetical protein I1A62_15080 [Rhodococcus sp. USK10]|uniref:8-oxoguanine DNA glycosylase OGG fold protein n=1 Tax=Rhodococcus sp. USK10 TaxID=2789739 RepID=UPI001C5DBA44|nr:hypothetical protein [Rhodococcus sp. USK10]QYB05682.1 hypothetical protein I1A62_15080 [Rhodococcus sp. USK10]
MWRESVTGIADLMRSDLLSSELEPAPVNTTQWANKGVRISSDRFDRDELFQLAEIARTTGDDQKLLQLFWDILAWGVMGNFRNAGRIVDFAATDDGRTRLLTALRTGATASHAGKIEDAYRAFVDYKVPRLGPAFFSKVLFFAGDRTSPEPRCLIFDSRVESALPTVTGTSYSLVNRPVTTYARYCRDMYAWSQEFGVTPEAIEARLYQLGKATENSRRAWLSAEVSLYREGRVPVTFDAILTRVIRDHRRTVPADEVPGQGKS